MTKRLLITVSHAVERFALARGRTAEPVVVVAMFQRLAYFHREAEVYRRIAATGAVTVIGIVEDLPPELPPGVSHVLLRPDEPLAAEWSVTVLTPHTGATLVALDAETVDPDATTLEAGRTFTGRYSLRREAAHREVLRLRRELASRLPPPVAQRWDRTLEHLLAAPGSADEARPEAAVERLLRVLDRRSRAPGRLRDQLEAGTGGRAETDPRSGLPDGRFLSRWMAGSVSGTLPVGLMLMRFPRVQDVRRDFGVRAELAVMQLIARGLRSGIGPVDRAVHLRDTDFLLVAPTLGAEALMRRHERVRAELAQGASHYPFVPLDPASALTVTRDRPLPVPQLAARVDAGPALTVV